MQPRARASIIKDWYKDVFVMGSFATLPTNSVFSTRAECGGADDKHLLTSVEIL